MAAERRANGAPMFTPLVCVSLMVFYVLAMQCLSTVAVAKRETGGWGWPAFMMLYMTGLAYFAAWMVQIVGHALGF